MDAVGRGVWRFTDPAEGEYREETFVPAGETTLVPVLNAPLDLAAVFPNP